MCTGTAYSFINYIYFSSSNNLNMDLNLQLLHNTLASTERKSKDIS